MLGNKRISVSTSVRSKRLHHDHAPDLCVPSSSSESTVLASIAPDGAGDSRESCRAMA